MLTWICVYTDTASCLIVYYCERSSFSFNFYDVLCLFVCAMYAKWSVRMNRRRNYI